MTTDNKALAEHIEVLRDLLNKTSSSGLFNPRRDALRAAIDALTREPSTPSAQADGNYAVVLHPDFVDAQEAVDMARGGIPVILQKNISFSPSAQVSGGGEFRELAERAVPFLRDEGAKYDDDGSNEPLELAREIEHALASNPPAESALSSASSALDGGAEAAPCPHARPELCDCDSPPSAPQARPDDGEAYGWLEPSTGNFVDHATKVAMPADASSFTLALYTHPTPAPDADSFDAARDAYQDVFDGGNHDAALLAALTAAQQEGKS